METTLDVRGVTRRYGTREVLKGITFAAQKGEIIALLGRNGTGKSTLMNTITGYLCQSGGDISVCGYDVLTQPLEARRRTGYLPEQPPLYPDMTVTEYLRYCCRLRGLKASTQTAEIARVIELTGLEAYAHRLSGRLSKGYRQRLGVAQALLGQPPLLILDEPGSGLDPLQMAQMREVIRRAGQDSTVLLSSHLLSEVSNVCGRAIVLDEGVIRYDGTMDALLRGAASLRLMYRGDTPMMALIRELPGVTEVTEQDCREDGCHLLLIRHEMDADLRAQVSALCYENHCALLEETNGSDALEDAFLHVIARKDISRKEVE